MEIKTPIKKPIQECDLVMNFKRGDLLFGLHKEAREQFLDILASKITSQEGEKIYFTVDAINSILSVKGILNPSLPEAEEDNPQQYDPLVQVHFSAWKQHPKYFPADIKEEDEADDAQEKREKKALAGSCKVALLTHAGCIHFCLDHIDVIAFRDKKSLHGKKYTSSELRLCAK